MSPGSRVVTLVIDGRDIGAREDQTIIEVATENGIEIPRLCYLEGLSAIGACRLCICEVTGSRGFLPACTTRVREGMNVRTRSEQLDAYRKRIVELLLAEGNHVCAICVSNGHCDLQRIAAELGVEHVTVPYQFPKRPVDASHRRFALDMNRCILCTRCVRVCAEIEGAHTWDIMGRGADARLITDLNQPWGASTSCTECGKCVQVCPTGALFEKGAATGEMTKRTQFLPYLSVMREDRR